MTNIDRINSKLSINLLEKIEVMGLDRSEEYKALEAESRARRYTSSARENAAKLIDNKQ